MQVRHVAVLGSTGSIGVNTLAVVERQPERFRVVALTAHSRVDDLFEQCLRFRPLFAAISDARAAEQLRSKLRSSGSDCEVLDGDAGLERVAGLAVIDTVVV